MPRPKKEGAEPKRRSRRGCWACKARKIKCDEGKPRCTNCVKQDDSCDYSVRLNWEGRGKAKDPASEATGMLQFSSTTIESSSSKVAEPGSSIGSPDSQKQHKRRGSQDSPAARWRAFEPDSQQRKKAKVYASPSMSHGDDDNASDLFRRSTGSEALQQRFSTNLSMPPTPSSLTSAGLGQPSSALPTSPNPAFAYSTPTTMSVRTPLGDDIDALSEDRTYGIDQGRDDIDIPRNDDANALTLYSPSVSLRRLDSELFPTVSASTSQNGFGFGLVNPHANHANYYAEPVAVKIPKALEPLPAYLTDSPMNLLYFHHFLNSTARILVPHDCPENAFRFILPQMAVNNINLLNLLLAYSASHRARLLGHAEPVNRIAHWVCNVFTELRLALTDSGKQISDANLAAAIMLASLEIISPNAFETPVPWQSHLSLAREMIISRGDYQSMAHGDRVSYFLSRWFAYLDVLGSLSSEEYGRPLDSTPANSKAEFEYSADVEIDCFLGFPGQLVHVLAEVAALARRYDAERIDNSDSIKKDWRPPAEAAESAVRLKRILKNRPVSYRGCRHDKTSSSSTFPEVVALNNAFHDAGLIHLYRRVLNLPSDSDEIKAAVSAILENLSELGSSSTAAACSIFATFTAGCEIKDPLQQETILEHLNNVENLGMAQAKKARILLQESWRTGKPWETLRKGEFMG